jgi:hypothetical protein
LKQGSLKKVKQKHVGKWIGTKGNDVVAISDTPEEIYEQLKKKGVDGVHIFLFADRTGKGAWLSFRVT